MTKSRPIMMKPEMIRAILDGRKTQTRRPVKGLKRDDTGGFRLMDDSQTWMTYSILVDGEPEAFDFNEELRCPYGVPGDRLTVREATRWHGDHATYEADGAIVRGVDAWKWRERLPAMFMPTGMSRLTLEIVSVRVERVQSISDDDARAEGYPRHVGVPGDREVGPREWYLNAWDRLYPLKHDAALHKNPWTWAITFKRVRS